MNSAAHGTGRGILARVAGGDRAAFAMLYDLLAPSVYGIALHILEDDDAAEAAARDTFAQVWSRASGYRPDQGPVADWVLDLARHRIADRLHTVRSTPASR